MVQFLKFFMQFSINLTLNYHKLQNLYLYNNPSISFKIDNSILMHIKKENKLFLMNLKYFEFISPSDPHLFETKVISQFLAFTHLILIVKLI